MVSPGQRKEITQIDSFEKIPCSIFLNLKDGSKYAASVIAQLIKEKETKNEPCVLGLATGSTPKALYAEMVRMHKEEGLSFKHVITFNLDEYYPMDKDAMQRYHNYIHRMVFNHIT